MVAANLSAFPAPPPRLFSAFVYQVSGTKHFFRHSIKMRFETNLAEKQAKGVEEGAGVDQMEARVILEVGARRSRGGLRGCTGCPGWGGVKGIWVRDIQ